MSSVFLLNYEKIYWEAEMANPRDLSAGGARTRCEQIERVGTKPHSYAKERMKGWGYLDKGSALIAIARRILSKASTSFKEQPVFALAQLKTKLNPLYFLTSRMFI